MQWALIVLAVAAIGGLGLATIRLKGAPHPPTWMALGHGTIAAVGLGLLAYAALTTSLPTIALLALGCFILAALGGVTLFAGFHLQGKPLPIPLVIGHGLIAITGVILLLLGVVRP